MPNVCPPSAPPGSKWVTPKGGKSPGWCITPDGTMLDASGKPIGTLPQRPAAPVVGQQPTFGAGGAVPGGRGSSPILAAPTGLMGGRGGSAVSGSGVGSSGIKGALVSGGLGILGQIFNYFGNKRQTDAQNENNAAATAQQRADAEARARAGSSIYSRVLGHYGHGGLATPEELFAALMRPPNPTLNIAGPSIFGALGKTAEDASAGASDYFSMQNRNQPTPGGNTPQDQIWAEILKYIFSRNNASPVEGGSTIPDYWAD